MAFHKDLYTGALTVKTNQYDHRPSHPLHHRFQMLPSGRRWKELVAKKSAFAKSFISIMILLLNGANKCTARLYVIIIARREI